MMPPTVTIVMTAMPIAKAQDHTGSAAIMTTMTVMSITRNATAAPRVTMSPTGSAGARVMVAVGQGYARLGTRV
jgi:hypothetical protein